MLFRSLRPSPKATFVPHENIIVGNVALYGATAGSVYLAGVAGERFCVRNSGATAVVEGVGNHGCEYMTGGVAVILGEVGANFAAGMSGGVAYVLDEHNRLYLHLNKGMVVSEAVTDPTDVELLRTQLTNHVTYTNSPRGRQILESFSTYLPLFKKVISEDYRRMQSRLRRLEREGIAPDQARSE